MPVTLNPNPSNYERQSCTRGLCAKPTAECIERSSRELTIGLINNMPDAALEATERQFLSLLDSASESFSIRLALYSLPGVPRNEAGARHVSNFYSSVENLWDKQLDGLIVTGREPLTSNLADEPYWESFTKVVDWAQNNTYSTVWSCLAAHAAILYMDAIDRVRNGHKYCGAFDCDRLLEHSLIAGTPARFKLPHSRWNGVPENELTMHGYLVLTRTAEAGVDTFVKECKSLFVFFQGHPEYEPNALQLEYRRDVGRYLRGETDAYPLMPRNYFDRETEMALMAVESGARQQAREELLADVSGILEKVSIENTWRATATCIYRNWLQHIAMQKKLRLQNSMATTEAGGADHSEPVLITAKDLSRRGVQATNLSQALPPQLRAAR
jgi:homoserine O-succinyltransferase/O-acetyltransferase